MPRTSVENANRFYEPYSAVIGISILEKFFLSLLIADGIMGTAGLMGQIGVGVLGMSLGFTGEAFWLAIGVALSAFTAALFALGGSFLAIFPSSKNDCLRFMRKAQTEKPTC